MPVNGGKSIEARAQKIILAVKTNKEQWPTVAAFAPVLLEHQCLLQIEAQSTLSYDGARQVII